MCDCNYNCFMKRFLLTVCLCALLLLFSACAETQDPSITSPDLDTWIDEKPRPSESDDALALPVQVEQTMNVPLGSIAGKPVFHIATTDQGIYFWPTEQAYLICFDAGQSSRRIEFSDTEAVALCIYQPQTDRLICATMLQDASSQQEYEMSCYEMDGTRLWSRPIQWPYIMVPYEDGCLYTSDQALYWVDADGNQEMLLSLPSGEFYIRGRDENGFYFLVCDSTDYFNQIWYRAAMDEAGTIQTFEEIAAVRGGCTLKQTDWEATTLSVQEDGSLIVKHEKKSGESELLAEIALPQSQKLSPTAACMVGDEYYVFAASVDEDGYAVGNVLMRLNADFQYLDMQELPVEQEVLLAIMEDTNHLTLYTADFTYAMVPLDRVLELRDGSMSIYRLTIS